MKKLLLILGIAWALAGAGVYIAWWKVSQGLTPERVSERANQVARELQIPWTLRFGKIIPRPGADFRVLFEDIEAVNVNGAVVLRGRKAEVRLPWTLFLTREPVKVNFSLQGVTVGDWAVVMDEAEKWLDARRGDSAQEISVPAQLADSTYNLRLSGIEGPWEGKTLRVDKLYLLNLDPRHPSAFEIVFPWELSLNGLAVQGETKALGEYRVSPTKVDLHYFLKNRLRVVRGGRTRTAEGSVEGKGFYHPRMGLFSTLTAKDDWLSFVGDIEWTKQHLNLNVPRFSMSHQLLLDMLPFDALWAGNGPYQGTGALGEFRWKSDAGGVSTLLRLRGKDSLKLAGGGAGRKLELHVDRGAAAPAESSIVVSGEPWFHLRHAGKASALTWSPSLFAPSSSPVGWLHPHTAVWDTASLLPWETLQVTVVGQVEGQTLRRAGPLVRAENVVPWEGGPRFSVVYDTETRREMEWVAEFTQSPLERLMELVPMESPAAAGFPFTGAIRRHKDGAIGLKLGWKGAPFAFLSRSSCRVLIQDRPELAGLLHDDYAHQLEALHRAPNYEITRWTMRSPSAQWDISGSWSNQPMRCALKIKETIKGRKARVHDVVMD